MLTSNRLALKRAQRWWGEEYQGHELPPQIMIALAYIVMGLVLIAFVGVSWLCFTKGWPLFLFPAPSLHSRKK